MSKVLYGVAEEFALVNLQGDAGGSQFSEDFVEVVYMLINSLREDDDIVDIYQVCFPLEPVKNCLLYTSPSPRDQRGSRMPSSA